MDLSVVIVNYNVKHFLEQCLCSVQKAVAGLDAEVIVVDNNSSDNSLEYLTPLFPNIRFVANTENTGFARACNQGWKMSSGNMVLFLNPDTLVPEDCFTACLHFFRGHPDAGALGVRMVDGSGRFLKESKRAFPSPLTSLYKLTGLARLFPRSKVFARYHLGHLDEHRDHPVDVLAGAFMMIRREVLENTGGFDETFFMYGEDVDLSYRIQEAGFRNYYFAGTTILHFKGESTRKGSLNYVRMFYKAMSTFVRKHYGGTRAGLFIFFIQLAIWLRAGLTAVATFIRRFGLPLIDAGLILFSFWLTKNLWSHYVRTDIQYSNSLLWIAFPAYTAFYLATAYYAGLYDRWYKWSELFRSTLVALVVLLAAYALLPEQYRFSRAIILFGSLLAFAFIGILRWVLLRTKVLDNERLRDRQQGFVIAGGSTEYNEVMPLITAAGMQNRVLGRVTPEDKDAATAIGNLRDLPSLADSLPFQGILFCEGALSFSAIVAEIQRLPRGLRAGIHASGSRSMVGSQSANQAGKSVSDERQYRLAEPYNRRLKRLTDVSIAVLGLLTFPLQLLIVKRPLAFLENCFRVLAGKRTWIGYAVPSKHLPALRAGVLASNGIPTRQAQALQKESLQLVDEWYARDYDPVAELKMLRRLYRQLGG